MKVLVSGGFDPIHIGHIRLIEAAYGWGDVYVALNSDDWLMRKKGYIFMPYEERAEILKALSYVAWVIQVDDADDTVAAAIRELQPHYFANGGDRVAPNPIEAAACKAVNCRQLWNVGGDKIQSSSWLVKRRAE